MHLAEAAVRHGLNDMCVTMEDVTPPASPGHSSDNEDLSSPGDIEPKLDNAQITLIDLDTATLSSKLAHHHLSGAASNPTIKNLTTILARLATQ